MRKEGRFNNRGFTLIEVIITAGIASIVMAAVLFYLVNNLHYNNMAQDEVYIQDQVRAAMKGMTKLVMEKKTVDIIKGSPDTLDNPDEATFNSGISGQIVFSLDSSGNLQYNDGSVKSLANNITVFKVEKDAANDKLITIRIKAEKGKAGFELVDQIYLRNKV